MTTAQQTLLRLLATALFSAPLTLPEEVDWQAVLAESRAQAVLPLAYEAARTVLPEAEKPAWQKAALERITRNYAVRAEHAEAAKVLYDAGVPFALFKGTASARYYPEPALRAMGDVDFLVPADRMEAAEKAIRAAGFARDTTPGISDPNVEWIYRRAPKSCWEMHRTLNGIPAGEVGIRAQQMLADTVETAESYASPEGAYPVPDTLHHGLILLLHTAHHLLSGGVGLRHFCDWAVFAASLPDEAFVRTFAAPLREIGLWRFAQTLERCAEMYLVAPQRTWAQDIPDALAEELLADLLETGNLGSKDPTRAYQQNLLYDRGSATVGGKSRLVRFFGNLTAAAKRDYPAAEKHAALLPLAWLCTAVRCTVQLVTGKRPRLDSELRRAAQTRAARYRALALFELERKEETP